MTETGKQLTHADVERESWELPAGCENYSHLDRGSLFKRLAEAERKLQHRDFQDDVLQETGDLLDRKVNELAEAEAKIEAVRKGIDELINHGISHADIKKLSKHDRAVIKGVVISATEIKKIIALGEKPE